MKLRNDNPRPGSDGGAPPQAGSCASPGALSAFRCHGRGWSAIGPCFLLLPALVLGWLQPAQAQTVKFNDFSEMESEDEFSFDELMSMEVAIASKKDQELSQIPSAVTVITDEDIRRAGVTTIAEALRMAPGMEVAREGSHRWSISARGFNDSFSNKLLVMVDGRSVYNQAFSGVFWHSVDALLEDIDRIEVIRGPGAAIWGANAVNGVVNIITKSSKDTQGFLLSGGGGTEEQGFGSLRYGGKISDNAWFRVHGKYFNRDDAVFSDGSSAGDAWQGGQGGFRFDWEPTPENQVMLKSDVYAMELDSYLRTYSPIPSYEQYDHTSEDWSGVNLLGQWSHQFSPDSDLKLQSYYDFTDSSLGFVSEERHTFDLDLQHNHLAKDWYELIWGLGYRVSWDDFSNSFTTSFDPDSQTTHLYSAFLQNEFTLVPDYLKLILGSKLEHNDFTGIEVQPSARVIWTPHGRHRLWASVSRAVRTPSRADDDVTIRVDMEPPGTIHPVLPGYVTVFGSDDMISEDLMAYELGHRFQVTPQLSLDTALYYHDYEDLLTREIQNPRTNDPHDPQFILIPVTGDNKGYGETYGAELALNWQPLDWWRLRAAFNHLQIDLKTTSSSTDKFHSELEGNSPEYQFNLTSMMDLPGNLALDTSLRYVDRLKSGQIPSYLELNARLAWKPRDNLELAVIGRNLLDSQHPEFKPTLFSETQVEIERDIYFQLTWQF